MSLDLPIAWTAGHLLAAALIAGVLLLVAAVIAWRTSGSVLAAGIGALVCTAYSGDTSWGFARDRLGMTSHSERLFMFAAGEIALFVCGVMARTNKKATATKDAAGTPGVPGVLVWAIAGAQIIPAFSESGFWAGLVRAFFGPIMAALLWHLAMGLEIRVRRPDALSTGLPAQIGHELRERLLSYLGLATRDRTAEQISRDRAHARAVRLGARRHLGPWGRSRLAAAVTRSRATVDGTRRHDLLRDLAGRRTVDQLRTMDVASPWVADVAPAPYPSTPLGVTGDALRRMDPIDAVRAVEAAHPDATPGELAALCTEYGVPVSETQVRIALRAAAQPPTPILAVQPVQAPDFDTAATAALAITQPTAPQPDAAAPQGTAAATPAQSALTLDLAPMPPVHLAVIEGESPVPVAVQPQPQPSQVSTPVAAPGGGAADRSRSRVADLRSPDGDAEVLERALELNAAALAETGRPVSQRRLQDALRIGQRRAQRIHPQLPTALPAPAAAAAAQPIAEGSR
ncbi:hypothetical protein [Streptomyces sp. NPDC001091]